MTQKSNRILIFTTAYWPLVGGSEIAIEQIIRRLPNVFFDVITPRLNLGLKKYESAENYRIHRLGFSGRIGKILFPIFGFIKANQLLAKNDYRMIHAYQASHAAGAAWLLKKNKPKLTFILTLQEGKDLAKQSFFVKFFRKLIIRRADIITTISNYLKKYAQLFNPKGKILIIPNGVEVKKFKNAKVDENLYNILEIKKEDRVIIHTGRLVKKNGLIDLIEAIPIIKKELSQIKLLIIGQGTLLNKLKIKVSNLGLDDSILFLGEINYRELPRYLKIADVFVRPSLSEGLGNSFLEAMAAGVPIVGTPVGGIIDFLTDGQTGLFCQPKNPPSIAEAVLKILTDQQLKEKIRIEAQALVEEKYNWDAIARQFENLYNGI